MIHKKILFVRERESGRCLLLPDHRNICVPTGILQELNSMTHKKKFPQSMDQRYPFSKDFYILSNRFIQTSTCLGLHHFDLHCSTFFADLDYKTVETFNSQEL